eukprot:865048-Amphidinium_carterae.1
MRPCRFSRAATDTDSEGPHCNEDDLEHLNHEASLPGCDGVFTEDTHQCQYEEGSDANHAKDVLGTTACHADIKDKELELLELLPRELHHDEVNEDNKGTSTLRVPAIKRQAMALGQTKQGVTVKLECLDYPSTARRSDCQWLEIPGFTDSGVFPFLTKSFAFWKRDLGINVERNVEK